MVTKATYRRVYLGLWFQRIRVHDGRAEVAGSRLALEQQAEGSGLNHKQEAGSPLGVML